MMFSIFFLLFLDSYGFPNDYHFSLKKYIADLLSTQIILGGHFTQSQLLTFKCQVYSALFLSTDGHMYAHITVFFT